MEAVLSSKTFHVLGIPIIFLLIGVFTNRLGRRDGDNAPKINDLSVGTTTILTSLGAVASDLSTAQKEEFLTLIGWFVGILCMLFISIDNDRFRSWKRDLSGNPTERKHLFWGIILPIIVSGSVFVAYQNSKL